LRHELQTTDEAVEDVTSDKSARYERSKTGRGKTIIILGCCYELLNSIHNVHFVMDQILKITEFCAL